MLGRDQLRRWIDRFGTSEIQVRRDHLISHVLVQLPEITPAATFFGGTALCRTHLLDWRLSEDIDLLVESSPRAAEAFDERLARAMRREFPGLTLRWAREGETLVGTVATDDLTVRVQLVTLDSSYRLYPTARIPVALRYADLSEVVEFRCPTLQGAAAMKLNAWADRAAPRDLCDLYGLLRANALTRESLRVAARVSRPVQPHHFHDDRMPAEQAWQAALGHQMRELPTCDLAFASVRSAVAALANWKDG